MNTPREILLRQHQAASPKLDAIRAGVVATLGRSPGPETISWRGVARSLRWHLAGWSAAWMVVMVLNVDHSPSAVATIARDKIPSPQQIWASLREHRRLLLELSDGPAVEKAALPGRRSEMKPKEAEV
jgi:hypothetical protein